MVRTRHAADADDEEQDNFLSLNSRRSRLSRRVPIQEDDSDDSGVVQFNREQGPVRRAGHRAAAKRVSYVEDYIDEYPIRRTRRSGHSLADDAEEDDCNSKRQLDGSLSNVASGEDDQYTPNSLHKRLRTSRNKSLVGEDESPPSPLRKKRKTAGFQVAQPSPKTSKQVKMEELEEMEESGIRRSSRTRKIVYNSFHMSDMSNKPKRSLGPNNAPDEDVEEEEEEEDEENNGNFTDMYSRVKRKRKCVKRYMDGETEVNGAQADDGDEEDDEEDDDDDGDDDNDDGDDDNEDGENEEDKDESKPNRRSYYLRENKPRTNFYNVIPETRRTKNRFFNEHDVRPPPRTHRRSEIYMSPARKHTRIPRRRTAFHGSSSTSSSASGSSSDEEHFQKRKAKSMKKSRQRCLPMNFDLKNLAASTVLRDRQKIGSSLADVDPMNIDKSITFASVGGLGKHVRALKEMVVFPLLYPEIFERFKISPPRGVLFYGPPGTGKTLVARALANECSKDDRRVAFYMRKGADCLSKWVGESERQLRLLFDQAYQTRPSIIFFDEIDGLAPVRSSRQDQIHSSIVSTLLALMDGLDSRGEIVVIGATNRIDSIDPALRRPGRFDREFLFPLPSLQARSQILKIHTKEWNPPLSEKFVNEVAENCIGYCGADMKALCTEAALLALRKRYPQIYTSTDKLQIDVSSIHIGSKDFYYGMQNIVPASQRSVTSPGRALSTQIQPLLHAQFKHLISLLNDVFPSILNQLANLDNDVSKPPDENDLDVYSDEEGTDMSIYEQKNKGRRKSSTIPQNQGKFFDFISYATRRPSTHRPRLMLSGNGDQGQSSHLAPAILHHLEQLPVHVVDLPSLFAVSARSPEESCAQIFREAKRTSPSIIYLPHINQWWTVVGETVKTTLLTLIQDLDPSSPLFLLATSEEDYAEIDFDIQDVFDEFSGEVTSMRNPTEEERRAFFTDIILNQTTIPPVVKTKENQVVEDLPKAPPPEPRKLTEAELKKLSDHEEATLTELRLFLRDVLTKLGRDRKFWIFAKPVDMEDVPDYYDIISKPMDLSTMMSKVDLHHYTTVKEFMVDINLICSNALEYNPDRDAQSRIIRHRACALRDTTNAIIKTELDEEFEKVCQGIAESRSKRGVESTTTAPSYYHTRPLNQGPMHPLAITRKLTPTSHLSQQQIDRNIRLSRRLQGGHADDGPSLEEVEKSARAVRSMVRNSPKKENENTPQAKVKSQGSDTTGLTASQESKHANQEKTSCSKSNSGGGSSTKKYAKKSIWGRSSYKKRKKKRSVKSEIEDENEDLVELDASVVDDDDDDAEDDDEEGSESEVQMEVEELASPNKQSPAPGTTTRSPRRDNHEATSSQDVLGKSPQKNSLNRCLNIDVGMKTPKDVQKSPSQKSPRLISPHLSDKQSSNEQINGIVSNNFNSEASPKLYQSDSCQKSPRQRHVSGSRSPRSQDISLPTEPDSKPSTRKSHDGSKEPPPDEELANINATSVTDPPTASDGVQVVVSAFDSGLGSSDSSGDSNDSAGKVLAGSVLTKPEECKDITDQQQVDTPSGSTEESQDVHMKDNEEKECPKLRVTRSMLHSKNTDSEIEHKVPVIIDKERLTNLLNTVVKTTEHYTICQLEKLYSIFAQCIFQHRMDLDKSQLLEVMEKRLGQYTNNMSKKMLKRKTNTGV